ncbi:MAG: nucleotidyltransferase domain-containing protein [Methylotenera sp.]|nr:nucleotidyltransferase domain-containing protein [Methylotenera sp.]
MRLTAQQVKRIAELIQVVIGTQARTYVFGSRLDDNARGGDLDLMLEVSESIDNPALLSAQLSAKISRVMHGRKVDVLLSAPNLARLPIHDIAYKEGQLI